jgi:NADP-dependent 3-hydroxy acid dehydrogenase YdfG
MKTKLRGKIVLITGGTHGIGRAVCQGFLGRGAVVYTCGRDADALDFIRGRGVDASRVDIRNSEEVNSWVAGVEGSHGRIDIVINAAGVSMPEGLELERVEPELWQCVVDTNLTGMYNVCRAALPLMKKSGKGIVINVLSAGAYRSGAPGSAAYTASKHGARALTETLVEEAKGTGVLVSAISPGPVDTNIWSHKRVPPSPEERSSMLRPEDVSEIILFVCERPRHVHIESLIVLPSRWG